jgi:DNA-binding NarL/FixJ family response regulator
MPTNFPIRVMLVDDNPRFRAVLRTLLERDDGILVVGEADRGDMVVELAERAEPHVVLMDLSMPGIDGLEATLALKSQFPGIEIVMLSMTDDADGIGSVLAGGASAFLNKATPAAEIVRTLKQRVPARRTPTSWLSAEVD